MQGIDSDLIRGHIDTIILKILSSGDKYGFEICKEVEERSGGLYELKQPTLYSCLKRLEGQKLISSYWEDSDIGGKRHYYKLTDLGRETYQKNQEDWSRSRQIIDNLIESEQASPLSFAVSQTSDESIEKIKSLQEEVENLKAQIKEKDENPTIIFKDRIVEVEKPQTSPENNSSFTSDQINVAEDEDVVPWVAPNDNKSTQIEESGENFNVEYAPNGEIISMEKIDDEKPWESEDEEVLEEELNQDSSPAQSSVFDEDVVFDENTSESQDVDIMELLGHTAKPQVEYHEDKQQDSNNLPAITEQEPEEEIKPFNFRMDDFVVKSKESYFESNEDTSSSYQYLTPEEKIEGIDEPESSQTFDFEKFKQDKLGDENQDEDQNLDDANNTSSTDDEIYQTPVYHSFGDTTTYEKVDNTNFDDMIYSPENQNSDEEQNQTSDDNTSNLKLFDDLLVDNDDSEKQEEPLKSVDENQFEIPEFDSENDSKDEQKQNEPDDDLLDFYKSTTNYNNIQPTFTEEEYKEKLSSLMNYSTSTSEEQKDQTNFEYKQLAAPKDFSELKINFEREGIKVKPHTKLVKESKNSRSYVESNKLNLINSWSSFGFVAFFTLLTYLIMHAYGEVNPYIFLIGIACLAVVPTIYTIIYFINPYKKKPAKYASKVYMLFAILITIQLLIIIYCVNLQLGFYSFTQEGYEHLYWIVPSLLSAYPLADAILHNIYFYSRNFHV